ncbi:3'(2'),5'-bisphosphate nucleotidase CysQ [Alkalimarinus sediminis]|uniref:3'(2'),5'-bisphosphate nucleotidase CysQ n=1 Tax=Alkalimarinus sediminis TaxID=1632866 RepID=A0A9E8KPA9_9ALTE|nr:3'(2'),5'-bisphosphate nucleotidase CysQ [Alkalimarinus sediminis]UZW74569.1 3'(2'),5'-bisphosphate nucleotidase CysQ [Alkalimarinus sediminis]
MVSEQNQSLMKMLPELLNIAEQAGEAILAVYNASKGDVSGSVPSDNIAFTLKGDDSPVTQADYAAHKVIAAGLSRITPDIPQLSEEGEIPPFNERANWAQYWLIDPLDGTKEFINRNGEYTVNIALVEDHQPVLGVVYVPVKKVFYYGVKGVGSWKKSCKGAMLITARTVGEHEALKVVASRRHGAEEVEKMISEAEKVFGCVEKVSMGSSLKICMLADGSADWYPRLALTSEWDTAAAQAVLEAAGGVIYDAEFNPMECNRKDSMLNPYFHAVADGSYDWKSLVDRALNH